jgi:GNAT superfamily N-acetyltransferase
MWSLLTSPRSLARRPGPVLGLVAYQAGRPAGRLLCSVNHHLNEVKGRRLGYFSLFESADDAAVASALFGRAESWLRDQGMTEIRGPFSPSYGDDYRGLLVHGFDGPPALMASYNPPYYEALVAGCGYVKDYDFMAYRYRPETIPERLARVSEHAMARYGFKVSGIRLDRLAEEAAAMKHILDRGTPDTWHDVVSPTMDEIMEMIRLLRPLAVPDLCAFARTAAGEPIGFLIGLPNYNEILHRIGGKLWPLGWLRFLLGRRQIRGVRMFVLFVVPEWHRKAVTGAMMLHVMRAGLRLGYTWAEGSTIEDNNQAMLREAAGAGGEHYRTYRLYRKPLS